VSVVVVVIIVGVVVGMAIGKHRRRAKTVEQNLGTDTEQYGF